MKLSTCPRCASRLIYPVRVRHDVGLRRRAIVVRRCPECEHRDAVSADGGVVWRWEMDHAAEVERLRAATDGDAG